jgi:DNA-directed RNA polymerase I subunit RPA43
LTYYPPLDGIVLSYSNVRLSEHPEPSSIHVTPTATNPAPVLAKAVDSFTVSFVWLSAEFLVIRPRKDAMVKAWVSYQAPSQLSLVFVNLISVTIRAAHLPRAWKFVQDFGDDDGDAAQSQSPLQSQSKRKKQQKGDGGQGYFVDGDGVKVEGFIVARIVDFEMVTTKAERRNGLLKIEASLVSEEEGREAEGKGAEVGRRVGKTPKGILRHSQES